MSNIQYMLRSITKVIACEIISITLVSSKNNNDKFMSISQCFANGYEVFHCYKSAMLLHQYSSPRTNLGYYQL